MARYDDLHTGTITVVGIISAVITFVIIVAAQVLYYQFQTIEHQRKNIDAPLVLTENALKVQNEELNSYSWIDQEKGTVSIPIEKAKQQVLQEMTQKTEEKPLETPAPSATPEPVPSTES
ncbi:hypothetical protein [uncultured Rubinisphaera sp.]|uniref:hypothetical protein n=1 Tax=uncultured Rubinisphaera sp. TaxID=1678686 RepID=UPI0030DCF10E|tara:strand:- start:354 stop:713 length:360 start_codon:yes stop_codon:yes gene_type:complete